MSVRWAYNYAAQLDIFHEELISGKISGVRARPALTVDVMDLYRTWCARRGEPSLSSPAHFVRFLCTRCGVMLTRKRYAVGMEVRGPHGVLFLAPCIQPPPGYETDWLGIQVAQFRTELATFKVYAQVNCDAQLA